MLDPVLDHLWQSTLVVLAAALLSLVLRRQRADVRYWVWFGASLKFLIPFAAVMALGAQLAWRTAEPVPTDGSGWRNMALQVIQPMSAADSESRTAALPAASERNAPSSNAPSSPDAQSSLQPVPDAGTPDSSGRFATSLPTALLAIWALGTLTIATIWTRRWARLSRLAHRATPLAVEIPAAKGIDIRTTPARMEPGVFGIFSPVLLLPEGIVERLSSDQLATIIRHERCHIQRRDNLTALIHMLAAAVFWFHPLVWWIGSRLIAERERACDEAVLAAGADPETYAGGMLEVCSFYLESPLPCASGVGGGSLQRRLRRITANRATRALGAAGKALLVVLPGAALAVPFWIGLWTPMPAIAQADGSENRDPVVQDFLARRAYFDRLGPLIWGPAADDGETEFVIRLTECEQASMDAANDAGDVGPTPFMESIAALVAYAFDVDEDRVVVPAGLEAIPVVTAMSQQPIDNAACRGLVRRSLEEDYGLIASVAPGADRVVVDSLDWPGPPPDPVELVPPGFDVDTAILDSYAGFFARPNTESPFLTPIFEVRREGEMLLIVWNGERIELAATSQTDFSAPDYLLPIFRERYTDLGRSERPTIYGQAALPEGGSVGVVLYQPMYEFRFGSNDEVSIFHDVEKRDWLSDPVALARRIDTDVAEAALAGLERRRTENLPDPATESLVRALVANLGAAQADEASPAGAAARQMREHLEQVMPGLVGRLGTARDVSLREVLPSGRDVYDVVWDRVALRVTIGTNADGSAVPLGFSIDCLRDSEERIERFGGCRAR